MPNFWTFILFLTKSESVKFSLIESVICFFTDPSVETIFSTVISVNFHWLISENNIFPLINQILFTEVTSEILPTKEFC